MKTIYDFQPKLYMEHPKGVSMTIPNEATSLQDLVRRASIMARLPEIAQSMETGEDEDFDDALDIPDDLTDYSDNLSYIERVRHKLEGIKADKDKKKAVEAVIPSDPIEDPQNNKSV